VLQGKINTIYAHEFSASLLEKFKVFNIYSIIVIIFDVNDRSRLFSGTGLKVSYRRYIKIDKTIMYNKFHGIVS